MTNKLGVYSSVLFVLGLVCYAVFIFGKGISAFLTITIFSSFLGFTLALFAKKGSFKRLGLIGNGLVIFIAIILPFIVLTFFWNQP